MYIPAAASIPKQGAMKYIQIPHQIQAKIADEKVLAGFTLKPEMEEHIAK